MNDRNDKARWAGPLSPGLVLTAIFLCGVALAGGASRVDSLAQPMVRLIAIVAIAGAIFTSRSSLARPAWLAASFLGLLAILIGAQLIPLPVAVWTALPGHDFYAAAAAAGGIEQPARPISISPDRTLNSLMALLPAVAALFVVGRLRTRERRFVLPLLLVLVVTGAVLGLGQISAGPGTALRWYAQTSRDATVGFFANRNHHALWLVMGLPLLAAWALGAREKRRGWQHGALAGGVAAFLLLMVVASGSRAALALAIVALVASAAMVARPILSALRALPARWRWIAAAAAALAFAAFAALALTFGRAASVHRLIVLDAGEDNRIRFLPIVRQLLEAFFPAGSGFGTFDPAFRRFEPLDALKPSYFNHAHNDLLEVVIEGGLAAGILLALFIAWWLWRSVAVWRMAPGISVHHGRAGSVIVLLALLGSIVDYPVRTPLMMVTVVIACVWMLLARHDGAGAGEGREGALRVAHG